MARYECKYYLTQRQYELVRNWIQPYIQPDPFAADRPGYTYTTSSLYLDSIDFRIGRMVMEGMKNRFKLRIRSYDDNPQSPIYMEIKRRISRVIEKKRIPVSREEGQGLLEGWIHPARVARGDSLHDLEAFLRLAEEFGALPMMRVRYEREAYEALDGEPVRITFDRELSYAFTPEANFSVNGLGWRPVMVPGIIFEIKFPDHYPFWVNEMIHGMQLQRVSIAKYVLSLQEARKSRINPMLMEGIFDERVLA